MREEDERRNAEETNILIKLWRLRASDLSWQHVYWLTRVGVGSPSECTVTGDGRSTGQIE